MADAEDGREIIDRTYDPSADDDAAVATANTMRERAGESRLKLWILLDANRLVATGVLAGTFFVLLVVTGIALDPPFLSTVADGDVLDTMFSTMASATITGVTLVVTITQVVISQELGPFDDQRARMSGAMDTREYIRELTGLDAAPADPSALLSSLVAAAQVEAANVADATAKIDDEDASEELSSFCDSLSENADVVLDRLHGAQFGTYDLLSAALDFNYGRKVFEVDRLLARHADAIDDPTSAALNDLRDALVMFGPAREHIKTLYFQWALTSLSQLVAYAAVPALLVSLSMLAFVDAATFTGSIAGVNNVVWVTMLALTVSLLPFLLLLSYVLRIATVAKRTLSIGPFVLRDSQR
ncbi:hypothetical protein [Halogeometricum sp. CBA1124]|jgi:hypothetical protein|uniref:hypothetical protein n=1 Tax=Halogeometricum sp. CBA1124 TaxID=2668071 RepID=UPI0014291DC2|nr:hypothetical protein [Halogeometricum sp. CBA1124]MUV57938.1 hypothetical protein [Halogeometricum sp. CBA1124]